MTPAEVDYLVIGAGARGMAFADHIIHADPTATVALVDRRAQPGGHWVDAYPFVRLHQPALYYGVESMPLGSGGRDLASKDVILAYYQAVQAALEATGRCRFLLQHTYEGEGRCRSLVDADQVVTLRARRRLVDSVYVGVSIPSTRPPPFPVDPACTILPLNVLSALEQSWSRYVVIGAGKTGFDAVLQLLAQGTDPDRITWVVSRDPWVIVRENIWPEDILRTLAVQSRTICQSGTWRELYEGFEKIGILERIWPDREPSSFRCATVSGAEVEQLRRITRVVRMGRVQRIEAERIVLDRGELPTGPDVLHVDCAAQGLPVWAPCPVFEPGRITLQSVLFCQPTASAALIAAAEVSLSDDDTRNRTLRSILPPEVPEDFLKILPSLYDNLRAALLRRGLWRFIFRNRLSIVSHFKWWQVIWAVLTSLWWLPRVESTLRRLAAALPDRALKAPGKRIT